MTFPNVAASNSVAVLEVGDVEFLGVSATPQTVISGPKISGGNLQFNISAGTVSGTYSVLTNSVLTAPLASWGVAASGTLDGTGSAAVSLPVSPSNKILFYRIRTP